MTKLFSLVVFTADGHPADHCSFVGQGGPWPVHCVKETPGCAFHASMPVPPEAVVVFKATQAGVESYSAFAEEELPRLLRDHGIQRGVIAGVATDYCVQATALDAVRFGLETWLLADAIAAVEAKPGDEQHALLTMRDAGVNFSDSGQIVTVLRAHAKPTVLLVVDVQHDFFPGGALAVGNAPRVIAPLKHLLTVAGLWPPASAVAENHSPWA